MTNQINLLAEKATKSRFRRFDFLMKKGRNDDAISIGEEFLEWIMPDNEDEIFYVNYNEMEELYWQKRLLNEKYS